MKLPKTVNRYCPYCKRHTPHKVIIVKKRQPRSLSYGSKVRAHDRGKARGHGNLGRYSKPAVGKWKMAGKKQTKKIDIRYECTVCHKQHTQRYGIRAKKVELV